MLRLLGLARAALMLLALGAAAPAPFDTYQLIMWQDRTPAQVEGMKRLGFTGLRLRGTGGTIDAAELSAREASGLPWYVENIATDFLAPYHRYLGDDKPVTFLFDQAKARRRADPADTSVFIREPSLSDPAWLARIRTRLADLVRQQRPFRPLFYNLADESGIGDLSAAWDADIGPASLAAMRDWLKRQYPSLAALNEQWGTQYAAWDQVMPELTDQALRRTDDNYSAWADFKAWMDVAFARAVRAGTEAVHEADPAGLAALEGAQVPG
ncbi:MAG TPA: beta-galactosidase, partial [Acetobacteraceae bacterium]|nr:beta-galactosidase [Acetobacteraceae bacterium]